MPCSTKCNSIEKWINKRNERQIEKEPFSRLRKMSSNGKFQSWWTTLNSKRSKLRTRFSRIQIFYHKSTNWSNRISSRSMSFRQFKVSYYRLRTKLNWVTTRLNCTAVKLSNLHNKLGSWGSNWLRLRQRITKNQRNKTCNLERFRLQRINWIRLTNWSSNIKKPTSSCYSKIRSLIQIWLGLLIVISNPSKLRQLHLFQICSRHLLKIRSRISKISRSRVAYSQNFQGGSSPLLSLFLGLAKQNLLRAVRRLIKEFNGPPKTTWVSIGKILKLISIQGPLQSHLLPPIISQQKTKKMSRR